MKKLKLITTLTALGSIAAATPVVVTGCSSSDKQDFTEIKYDGAAVPSTKEIPLSFGDFTLNASDFTGKYNGTEVTMQKISATSSNDKVVTIISGNEDESISIKLHPVAAGDSDIKITLKDKDGHQGNVSTKITVKEATKAEITLPATGTNCKYVASTKTLTITKVGTTATIGISLSPESVGATFELAEGAPAWASIIGGTTLSLNANALTEQAGKQLTIKHNGGAETLAITVIAYQEGSTFVVEEGDQYTFDGHDIELANVEAIGGYNVNLMLSPAAAGTFDASASLEATIDGEVEKGITFANGTTAGKNVVMTISSKKINQVTPTTITVKTNDEYEGGKINELVINVIKAPDGLNASSKIGSFINSEAKIQQYIGNNGIWNGVDTSEKTILFLSSENIDEGTWSGKINGATDLPTWDEKTGTEPTTPYIDTEESLFVIPKDFALTKNVYTVIFTGSGADAGKLARLSFIVKAPSIIGGLNTGSTSPKPTDGATVYLSSVYGTTELTFKDVDDNSGATNYVLLSTAIPESSSEAGDDGIRIIDVVNKIGTATVQEYTGVLDPGWFDDTKSTPMIVIGYKGTPGQPGFEFTSIMKFGVLGSNGKG